MRYKNIIFDFGGVLVNLDKQRCIDNFLKLGFDATPYLGLYAQNGLFAAHEHGLISNEEFLNAITCEASNEAKAEAWLSMLTDVPMQRRKTILRLRKTHRVFMLSNTNDLHWQMSLKQWWNADGHTLNEYFEKVFLSCELHQCKPDPEIFKTAIREAGLNPSETLFIDDSQTNCDAAASVGLGTLCATGDDWMGCVATIGHFDGVHTGHRFLIDRVKQEAEQRGLWSLLITFDRHPRTVVNASLPSADSFVPQALTSAKEKIQLLHASGVDEVEVLQFDQSMAQMSARDFLLYIKEHLGVKVLLVGYDHHFGHNRNDTIADYQRYGQETGVEVVAIEAMPGVHVSSSAVRRLLNEGDVAQAAQLLGRPYTLTGRVVEGQQIGRQIGFPTANLNIDDQMLPARGVYAARCMGMTAVLNIGYRPTVNASLPHDNRDSLADKQGAVSIEVHIPGFSGNLYGQELSVELLRRIRPERQFGSLDELRQQIALDIESAR